MKEWTVEIYVLDQDGKEKPARCFTKAVYNLHPSFANPVQSMRPDSRWPACHGERMALTPHSFHGASLQVHQRGLGRV
jgi:hypothetical protein